MSEVKRNHSNYPSTEMARATFTDAEFAAAIKKHEKAHPSVIVYRFESYSSKVTITTDALRSLADLTDSLPGCYIENSLDIVRGKTPEEMESDVIASRKSEMFYQPDSPYYLGDEYVSRESAE